MRSIQMMKETVKQPGKKYYLLLLLLLCQVLIHAQQFSKADSARLMQLYRQLKNDTGIAAMKSNFSDPLLLKQKNTPTDWALPSAIAYNTAEADIVVRLGDIDNFGFGWDLGYNPFSGKTTLSSHAYPYKPGANDISPTDRIMVPTGFKGSLSGNNYDGYTKGTTRPDNIPQPFVFTYDLKKTALHVVKLQFFADDFQAPVSGAYFRVMLNGQRIPYLENLLNSLNQTGPVGKLLTFTIDPGLFPEVQKGKLSLLIDDPVHNVGDGYAIDFIRLLINPKNLPAGTLSGTVLDQQNHTPIAGAQVSAGDDSKAVTDAAGKYVLNNVPAGLAVINAMNAGYRDTTVNTDLPEGTTRNDFTIYLEKSDPQTDLEKDLDKKGHAEMYNILFDPGKAILKNESMPGLQQLAALITKRTGSKFIISGHTDNTGEETDNVKLSYQRALAVINWLVTKGINAEQITAKGYGSSMPVAGNNTETGRAKNRRVQLDLN